MEWTVITVLAVIVGLGVTVGTPMIALIRTMTKLDMSVNRLNEKFDDFSDRNSKAHNALFDTQREHDKRLDDIEREVAYIRGANA